MTEIDFYSKYKTITTDTFIVPLKSNPSKIYHNGRKSIKISFESRNQCMSL